MLGVKVTSTITLIVVLTVTILSCCSFSGEVEITSGIDLDECTAWKYDYDPSTESTILYGWCHGDWYPTNGYEMPDYETYKEAWLTFNPKWSGNEGQIRAMYDVCIPNSYFGYYTEPFRWTFEELKQKYNELKGA